jgi:xanthine phosphoribosyltransferase
MHKRKINWQEFQGLVGKICRGISNSDWRPDYVVGITRGGLLPAVMISQYFNVPCETLKVSLRDHGGENATESNLWMAEDAFGYVPEDERGDLQSRWNHSKKKNILIVDDINDTGATINWILNDWQSGCLSKDPSWNEVWNNNVRFATVFDNLASKAQVKMDYVGEEINKAEIPVWIDFPFEDWWTK